METIKRYYAAIQQPILPLNIEFMTGFFGQLNDPLKANDTKRVSTVQGYKSALKWWLQDQKVVIDPLFEMELDKFMKGYKNRIANLKLKGILPINEGKAYLTFNAYIQLTTALFQSANFKTMLFTWPFIVIQWNLIGRSASVAAIMYDHVRWDGDSLIVELPKHKGDQEGDRQHPRHLYANPLNPVICPVLALAMITFTQPFRAEQEGMHSFRLFDGEHSEARFSSLLRSALVALSADDLTALGCPINDIGTHSTRKGAASYCAGFINGPSTLQIFLRAGWSIGNVPDRYIFAASGGDQLAGRVLAGLPFDDVSFSSLPPHFHGGLENFDLSFVCPLYPNYPSQFKVVVPYLLASLIHHEPWLRANLSPRHPLFTSFLFASGSASALRPFVKCGVVHCVGDRHSMTATGIPQHLVIVNRLHSIEASAQQARQDLLNKCAELPNQVTDAILSRLQVNGAVPVTAIDISRIIGDALSEFRAHLGTSNQLNPPPAAAFEASNKEFAMFTWGSRFHMIPEDWMFPAVPVKDVWNLWHFGYFTAKQEHIRPLKELNAKWDLKTKASKLAFCGFCRVGIIMAKLETLNPPPSPLDGMSAAQRSTYFDTAFKVLMEVAKPGITTTGRRWADMSLHTIGKALSTKRKRKAANEESDRDEENERMSD